MQFIDKLIAGVAPQYALKRVRARQMVQAYYEATRPTRTRKNTGDNTSANVLTNASAETLRAQARHLDQNHDLAKAILRELVNKTSGSKGIQVESLARTKDGRIANDFVSKVNDLWKEWCLVCDATGELSFSRLQRLTLWSKYRDGEAFGRMLSGRVPGLSHHMSVMLTMQPFEADYVPFHTDESKRIYQGIKRNRWHKATDFLLCEGHPSEAWQNKFFEIPASAMVQAKTIDRIQQARGISIFAASMNRINDLKDYEDSERVAARISASFAAYIKKGDPTLYDDSDDGEDRGFSIESGMIFDGLKQGEDIGSIESNRPSQLLQPFRDSMLKAITSGSGSGYAGVSKNYDGTYSSQRQQLVDDWINYEILQDDFIHEYVRPIFRRFLQMAITSGVVSTQGLDPHTIYDADFRGPIMPWIDPKKEAEAHMIKLAGQLTSPQKVMRNMGENPTEVLDQIKSFIDLLDSKGLQKPEYLATS